MKKIQPRAILFAFSVLILTGCSNIFIENSIERRRLPEASLPEIPEGFGTVRVSLTRGTARTVIPDPVELSTLHLEYWFERNGESAEKKDPVGDRSFAVEAGNYVLTVKGLLDANDPDSLAAQGDTSFTISAGTDAGTENVTLRPVTTGEGTGSLEFGLRYPAGVTVQSLTLTRIAGDESFDLLIPPPGTSGWDPVTMSGVKGNIPVGYYLLQATLRNSAGAIVGKSEVAHIYQNLTAKTTLAEYTFTADDFSAYLVTNANDSGPGSLRQALIDAPNGQIVRVMLEPGSVIELEYYLSIDRSITIAGNGVTLTPAASRKTAGYNAQLLSISGYGDPVEATISRVHFKDGRGSDYGGAISNGGTLTLESCIFSGNQALGATDRRHGGAISSGNTLTIRGCTFYGNTAGGYGGAVYFSASGKTLTLTGNLFYGNTAGLGCPVVYNAYGTGIVSASYNVVDAGFGLGSAHCGWTQGTGDTLISGLPISPKTFRLYGNGAKNVMGSLPADYPAVDFYGQAISANIAVGAVQASTAGSGYFLGLSVNNSLAGTLEASPEPDEDGFISEPFAVTTTPNSGYAFGYWLVDGVKTASAPASLSDHTFVQAVFNRMVTVDVFIDEPGSFATPGTLRYALTNAQDQDIISFIGVTAGTTAIELTSVLPGISKSITVKGNGVTLTRAASWTTIDYSTQLLDIYNNTAEVTISRVHFKDGRAISSGGAIDNRGTLTLESCIFSGNQGSGGAIYSYNTLTIRGCTFYGNTGSGAVYSDAWGTTLTLTGNLFYGNIGSYPVVYDRGDATISASYNVVDAAFGTGSGRCGWVQGTGDTLTATLPISPKTFKLLSGSEAAGIIDDLPADYPAVDFFGQEISVNAAAGAIQASAGSGYYLELSVNNSAAGTVGVSPNPDVDGLFSAPFTITASLNPGYTVGHWLVNGIKTANAPTSLSDHAWVQAVFNRAVTVNVFTDGPDSATTSGTLRYVLTNAQEGDHISFSGVTPGTTAIELESALPQITKSISIAGNGVTLTRAASWTAVSAYGGLLYIVSSAGEVTISRVLFKDGWATNYGGAITSGGVLTLESCIFSGNQSGGGGAIDSSNTLTIKGCTFYGNTAGAGGAVYFRTSGKTLILTGNLFYRNAALNSPVVNNTNIYGDYGIVSASYNVVDTAFGTGSGQCGWTQDTGDAPAATLPISGKTFKLLSGGGAAGIIDSLPEDYPAVDFYGQAINVNAAAGAVQASAVGSGYYLELSANNSLAGTVGASSNPDADGLFVAPPGISATPDPGYTLSYWLVNGVKTANAPTSLSEHTFVQAVFNRMVTVNVFTDGAGSATTPGTLRYALANAQAGDHINFSGVTPGTTAIELESALPSITKSLTIAGNGVTLTRAASWTAVNDSGGLLFIGSSAGEVTVRRVLFKDGLVLAHGGAIYNAGTLTLESCIFSGNRNTGGYGDGGGAIDSFNTLTIRGCTFYRNSSGRYGGAVYFNASGKTLTLTGNLFYENAGSMPVVYNYSNSGTINASYNVVDTAFGTGYDQCGWTQGTGDTPATILPVSPKSFRLLSGSEAASVIDFLPVDYPTTDFYGQPISANAAAGAVQATAGSGYYLELSVNNGLAGTVVVSPPSNADGLFSGSFVITATPNSDYTVGHWLVNGVKTANAPTNLSDHAWVQVVFNRTVTVNVFADGPGSATTSGTLRNALTNTQEGDIIFFSGVTPGSTVIELESDLPAITKSISIVGNGVTLTRSASWTTVNYGRMLYISGSTVDVTVSRVLFRDGQAVWRGRAIYNNGTLTLESCIFSGNQITDGSGGAIYSVNTLTIRGCTFYGNSASYSGGAVFFSAPGQTLILTGNLFYGNTASVVYANGTVDASYNVVDVAFGTGSGLAGWTQGPGDIYITTGDPIDAVSFTPKAGSPGHLDIDIVQAGLADFPVADFYGNTRTFPGAAGAVK